MNILLADSDMNTRSRLVNTFSKFENIKYDVCSHGLEAFNLLMQEEFNLFFLSFNVEGMPTVELIELALETNEGMNIIVIADEISDKESESVIIAGAIEVVKKPKLIPNIIRRLASY